jgi:WD40 repeat protein
LPKVGISLIAISQDAKMVATKNESQPNIVWVWDITKLSLNSILVQKQEVTHLEWCPQNLTLNVSTGNDKLYIWTLKVASLCQIPVNKDNFCVQQVVWNPNGRSFTAMDKNGLVFVYPQISFYDE